MLEKWNQATTIAFSLKSASLPVPQLAGKCIWWAQTERPFLPLACLDLFTQPAKPKGVKNKWSVTSQQVKGRVEGGLPRITFTASAAFGNAMTWLVCSSFGSLLWHLDNVSEAALAWSGLAD